MNTFIVNKVLLLGITGTGKTTLAKGVAERLKKTFIDPEEQLIHDKGDTIANLIRQHGQSTVAGWLLNLTLPLLKGATPVVIPTPPTLNKSPEFWELVKGHAHAIHLQTLPMEVYRRVVEREMEDENPPQGLLEKSAKQTFYHRVWLSASRRIPSLPRLWLSGDFETDLDHLCEKIKAMEAQGSWEELF